MTPKERTGLWLVAGVLPLIWVVLLMVNAWATSNWVTSSAACVGTYRVRYSYGEETLVLNRNGTFEQQLTPYSGKILRNQGRWKYNGEDAVLRGHLWLDQSSGPHFTHIESGVLSLPVEGDFGSVTRMTISEDAGLFYEKDT